MGNRPLETPQIIVGIGQSVGIQRDSNEDSIFTLTSNLFSNGRTVNFGLYIIADGMGGHENGELASSIAVSQLSAHVINTFFLPSISATGHQMDITLQEVMRDGVINAHEAIKQAAMGSGTTLTAVLILGDQMTIAHVGDSRAYSISPGGQLQLLTHDHSLVKRLEEIGQITPAEASVHPKRNLLYRALGQGDQLEPDITSLSAYQGLQLMLCTDGLWGAVSEDELRSIIVSSSEPQTVCQSLIESANAAGGPDNISVIIIHIPG
jgi:protein phosphatase